MVPLTPPEVYPGDALALGPTTHTPGTVSPTPRDGIRSSRDALGVCVGGGWSVYVERVRVRGRGLVPPSSSPGPKTAPSGSESPHLPPSALWFWVELTEGTQPQEQNLQQAARREPGRGLHGLPWPRWSGAQ